MAATLPWPSNGFAKKSLIAEVLSKLAVQLACYPLAGWSIRESCTVLWHNSAFCMYPKSHFGRGNPLQIVLSETRVPKIWCFITVRIHGHNWRVSPSFPRHVVFRRASLQVWTYCWLQSGRRCSAEDWALIRRPLGHRNFRHGRFLSHGGAPKWMGYNGQSKYMDDLGVPPWLGKPQLIDSWLGGFKVFSASTIEMGWCSMTFTFFRGVAQPPASQGWLCLYATWHAPAASHVAGLLQTMVCQWLPKWNGHSSFYVPNFFPFCISYVSLSFMVHSDSGIYRLTGHL